MRSWRCGRCWAGDHRRGRNLSTRRAAQHHDAALPLHILRNSVHFGSQYLWPLGLVACAARDVFGSEFTMPAWTILLAPSFSAAHDQKPRRAVSLGLVGVLLSCGPGRELQPAALIVLIAALGYGARTSHQELTQPKAPFAIVSG